MNRNMLKSKIHRAVVTGAQIDYVGSIEIDSDLLEAAEIIPNEQVHVWNVTTGERFVTYAVPADHGSGVICINGAAAHLVSSGDLVIIASFIGIEDEAAKKWEPTIVFVDEANRITTGEAQAQACAG